MSHHFQVVLFFYLNVAEQDLPSDTALRCCKEMLDGHCAADRPTQSTSSSADHDEQDALLPKSPSLRSTDTVADSDGENSLIGNEIDTRTLLWIMIGIWIGMFGSGLGKHTINQVRDREAISINSKSANNLLARWNRHGYTGSANCD